jgi:flagellar hook-basal body complex protein FliE
VIAFEYKEKAMSNDINTSSMMLQMRSMTDMAASNVVPLKMNNEGLPSLGSQASQGVEFGSLLKSALQQVNSIQTESRQLKNDFISGKEGVDLVQVMIASEKSSVAFGATLEIRNKLLKAYEEVKSIRV